MSTYSSRDNSPSRSPRGRRMRTCARRCERFCCALATFFPLAFVYSLTTWACWVEYTIGLGDIGAHDVDRVIKASSVVGIIFYLLLNISYTTAVFTDPGSPTDTPSKTKSQRNGGKYSILPTSEPDGQVLPSDFESITVSSTGGARFCKKCQTAKPDRTHHCSTCKRCVLKMDHHCPWLATCVGLHNYKPFILFLIYTCLFCYVCFFSSGWWLWTQMFADDQYLEAYAPINIIMLCVIAGIIGLVLTGFTGWHLYLAIRGQTTIECLEKTRYLSGVRSRVERNRREHAQHEASHHRSDSNDLAGRLKRAGEDILEFHANAVPGASRYEEGEEHTSPAPSFHRQPHPSSTADLDLEANTYQPNSTTYTDFPPSSTNDDSPAIRSLRRNYNNPAQPQTHQSTYETTREADRYAEYLDSSTDESTQLPNAFDLGWRRNLSHLFGPNPWFWLLPVTNTTGDGWRWEVSERWRRRRSEVEAVKRREAEGVRRWYQPRDDEMSSRGVRQVRSGGGGDGAIDDGGAELGRSAVSMQTLPPPSSSSSSTAAAAARGRGRVWGGRYRKDVDTSGVDGETEEFEVSSDEDEDDAYRDRQWRRSTGQDIDD